MDEAIDLSSEYVTKVRACSRRCLNSADGLVMMEELKAAWDGAQIFHPDPQEMARNATMRDCYKQLEAWKDAKGLGDE